MAFPGTTTPFNNDTEQELLAKIILQLQAGIPSGAPAVSYNAGAADATTQRTVTASDSPDVVSNAAIKTAVEAVAQAGAGAVSATTQRVVAATDSPEVASNAAIQAAVVPSATQTAYSTFRNTAVTNTAVSVKASAGVLAGAIVYNAHTAITYLDIFDLASGSVVLGTTVPILSLPLLPGGGIAGPVPIVALAAALSIAVVATPGGAGAPGATALVNLFYK